MINNSFKYFKTLISILVVFSPWRVKHFIYTKYFCFNIDKSCSIGLSILFIDNLEMDKGSSIGHFNLFKGLSLVKLKNESSIGNLNWITGFPLDNNTKHFAMETNRFPALYIGQHSSITNRHLIDCTSSISIGKFSTLAGFRSQLLTHSINLYLSKQESSEILIGDYCFIGSNSVLLKGTSLPSYSILGANSTLTKKHCTEFCLYAGSPAAIKKKLDADMGYFIRTTGFVW